MEAFFDWVQARLEDNALLPTNRLTQALGYAHQRKHALSVHLSDPDVAVDTNHLERAKRASALERLADNAREFGLAKFCQDD